MQKKIIGFFLTVILVIPALSWESRLKESKDIREELTFMSPKKPQRLEVDNIFGSIDLQGYSGKTVKAVIKKTIYGKTEDDIELAKDEVTLEISQENNIISFYVDGPFRCRKWSGCRKYRVNYDFEIKVPQNTQVCLKTVNNGNIIVNNINRDFTIRNVNGRISMKGVSGSGEAHTVNGKIQVFFDRNPRSDCSFKTVNGNLEINFPDQPSADFYLKTFNGNIYTDYDVEYLPLTPGKAKRINGKYVYKSNRYQGIRIGKGGPNIKMGTLNGNILIVQKK